MAHQPANTNSPNASAVPAASELRKFKRFPFTGTVQLRDDDDFEYRGVDLSAGGVGFLSLRPFGVGSAIDVMFLRRSVVVKGVIRFQREAMPHRWRVGVEFNQPQPELLEVAGALSL